MDRILTRLGVHDVNLVVPFDDVVDEAAENGVGKYLHCRTSVQSRSKLLLPEDSMLTGARVSDVCLEEGVIGGCGGGSGADDDDDELKNRFLLDVNVLLS